MRRIVGVLIAIGLGIGVFLLWPRSSEDTPANTEAAGTSTTVTTTSDETTTSTLRGTTTTTAGEGSHVVETEEEAEEILREHYFTWFRGIYEEDAEAIRSTVLLDSQVEAAIEQFESMEFLQAPTRDALEFSETAILRSDSECLAVWTEISADFREGSSAGVVIFRQHEGGWRFLSSWSQREDLWEDDCESSL